MIKVQVKDGSSSEVISETSIIYTISLGQPTITSLIPNRTSPEPQGAAITFTCTATGSDLQYRFLLNGPGTRIGRPGRPGLVVLELLDLEDV